MPDVFIYGLCEPDTGAVRYVGKADNPDLRLTAHLSEAKRRRTWAKNDWIRSLTAAGKRPALTIIEKVASDGWEQRERYGIAFYREQGADLLNMASGGRGLSGFHSRYKSLHRIAKGLLLPHLRAWRNFRVMTQAQLASAAGVSRATIGAAEQGERVRHTNVQKLATALGLDASTLAHRAPAEETERVPAHAG